MKQGSVEANGITFTYLEEGDAGAPLVLLLHGFPDNAETWDRVQPALAEAGYRTVAPNLRGYPPTTAAPDGRYDSAALAGDIAGLIDALNGGQPAFVVGHDWGALATYAAVGLHPEKVRRAVTVAIDHPGTLGKIVERPELLHHAFHVWLFQLPGFSDQAVLHNDLAMIEFLWNLWSPGIEDADHIKRVKETLAPPGAVDAALGYYRAIFQFPIQNPELAQKVQFAPSTVPILTVFGGDDPGFARSRDDDTSAFFAAEHRVAVVDGAGHFVQREQPEKLTRFILDWFKEGA